MRRRLGNFANILCLLLCAATLVLWKTQPHWMAIGWAGRHELEVHIAEDYVEFTTAHHMSNNSLEHANPGEFFAFHHASSGWGNPLMRKWDSGSAHIWQMTWSGRGTPLMPQRDSDSDHIWQIVWFGHGSNRNPVGTDEPSSTWLALDSRILCLLWMLWPGLWVARRMFARRQPAKSKLPVR